jgi:hypothetical protein
MQCFAKKWKSLLTNLLHIRVAKKKAPLHAKFKVCLPFQEEEKKVKKEEMDETIGKNKRRMLGNIKFIGELFKLKV